MARKKSKLSSGASKYISNVIFSHTARGNKPTKQKIAIAYSEARQAGYKIPKRKKK